MLGTLVAQRHERQNVKTIQLAMPRFCRDNKTFNHAKITKIILETVRKEPSVEYNYLPRGRLKVHHFHVLDRKQFVNKIKKILKVVMLNNDSALDKDKVKQFLN